MLHALGADRIDLLSNNPDKAAQLAAHGVTVAGRTPTGVHSTPTNLRYLHAKVAGSTLAPAHDLLRGRLA